ncbi:uncharacterized protein LOC128219077 [Mya arenaria]|uniref:uncharacterized protein LOC128219077 n=1 Tax=Mya arenaria TaxID=6604 RepID=UPI0022E3A396|nr:uncharacterized protein LOC128219077 [Mya arenaria]
MDYQFGFLIFVLVEVAMASQNDNVHVVLVERPGITDCKHREVCADIFNFTRIMEDGSGQLESRFLQNCDCPGMPCVRGEQGRDLEQLLFRETRKQSMLTCEAASQFSECSPGETAKEQHTDRDTGRIYVQINCVCPNNEDPGSFRDKMTEQKRYYELTEEEQGWFTRDSSSRFYKCREAGARRFGGLF